MSTQRYLPRYGTIHSGLDSATSIISLENVPIDLPTDPSDGGSPPTGVVSSIKLQPLLRCQKKKDERKKEANN